MDQPENNLQDASRPVDSHQDTSEDLRRQMNLLFGALLISSLTLNLFLGLQGKRAAGEYLAVRTRAIDQFKQNQQEIATIHNIYGKLVDFGRTHPDFQQRILSRYLFDTNTPPAEPPKK
jgi:hypothetical protein